MVAFIIYWGSILINIAWLVLSVAFSIYYLAKKENGNLWAFAFFNVLAAVYLGIILLVYKTWDFNITMYSSLIQTMIFANLGLTLLQAILGRQPKVKTA